MENMMNSTLSSLSFDDLVQSTPTDQVPAPAMYGTEWQQLFCYNPDLSQFDDINGMIDMNGMIDLHSESYGADTGIDATFFSADQTAQQLPDEVYFT